jgi:transcriptional regulator with XRE-family HTH domain
LVNQAIRELEFNDSRCTRANCYISPMARKTPRNPLGEFIRNQREITRLSLRQLANLAHVSNPYLSQIERGLYEPSASVLKAIAGALGISSEKLYQAAGWIEPSDGDTQGVESAIRTDPRLSSPQKEALIAVYRRFVEEEEK